MASKRLLKKKVMGMVCDILNDCDYIALTDDKNAAKADGLMDEAVDFHDTIISQINKAKSKADYKAVTTAMSEAEIEFVKKLNGLN
jgi:hypothetical protein